MLTSISLSRFVSSALAGELWRSKLSDVYPFLKIAGASQLMIAIHHDRLENRLEGEGIAAAASSTS